MKFSELDAVRTTVEIQAEEGQAVPAGTVAAVVFVGDGYYTLEITLKEQTLDDPGIHTLADVTEDQIEQYTDQTK